MDGPSDERLKFDKKIKAGERGRLIVVIEGVS